MNVFGIFLKQSSSKTQISSIIIDHSDAHIVRWLRNQAKSVIVTCHDLVNLLYPENLRGSVRLPILSDNLGRYSLHAMEYADSIVAVSSETAKNIDRFLNIEQDRVTVIPNSVDPIFRPLPEEEARTFRQVLETSLEKFCLLNVGSNHPRKNLTSILNALYILRQKDLPVELWKVSDPFSEEDQRFIKSHGLEDSTKYLGYLDKQTLVKAYNAVDALIAPSLHEGFGITLLEAMACGTPVITSNVSAMPEVVSGSGILVDPYNVESISDGVFRLYEDPAFLETLKRQGLQRSEAYSREKIAQEMLQVYRKLTSPSNL